MPKAQQRDFEVLDCGSIIQIQPLTEAASEWIDQNVASEGWQWMGPYLCCDHRPGRELLGALEAEGFRLS